MANRSNDSSNKYLFLHDHVAKEANIFDVLNEISSYQEQVLSTGKGTLATFDILKKSRNIKITFTPSRNKNIAYLVDMLVRTYPEDVKAIISFDFHIDENTKKLTINETSEYSVLIKNEDYNKLQADRDIRSVESLLKLLIRFRLFNLTKLIKKSKNRSHMSKIIKSELGKNIFTFKSHVIDKNNLEYSEDFCFHHKNYDSVKKSLNIDNLKKIISANSALISRRLQKFGIINTDFSDYRESKIDYLLNILLEDISTSLTPKDLVDIKNFESLRTCLLKVDKLIDPAIAFGNDILKHIKDNGLVKKSEIISIFDRITDEIIVSWAKKNLDKYRILSYTGLEHETIFIDNIFYLNRLPELHQQIIYDQETFIDLPHNERNKKLTDFELLCNAGKALITSEEKSILILENEENISKVRQIIKDFEDFQRTLAVKQSVEKGKVYKEKSSIFRIIIDFFKSLFSSKKQEEKTAGKSSAQAPAKKRTKISKNTKDLFNKIKTKSDKLIPLSKYIELSQKNELKIDEIIEEIRGSELKIVIPIYNARKNLYPKRSRKLLISDMEYLLVDSEIIQSSDSIREFSDSLVKYKLRDETIPPNVIMTIEKYLLTIYRQLRAQKMRKEKGS